MAAPYSNTLLLMGLYGIKRVSLSLPQDKPAKAFRMLTFFFTSLCLALAQCEQKLCDQSNPLGIQMSTHKSSNLNLMDPSVIQPVIQKDLYSDCRQMDPHHKL